MHPERAAEDPKNYGTELVNHWTKETFSTPQGKIITEAFRKAQNLLDIEYLEGNHDNYLTKSSPEYPADTWSAPHAMPGRSPDYHGQGIFMEHGHQCDSSNGNDAGTLPSDWAIGTNSPFGLFLTQLAFLRPKSMREFEPKASGLLDTLQRAPGQRLKQMAYAGDCFYYNRNPFYVYAMGHTHAACLRSVFSF